MYYSICYSFFTLIITALFFSALLNSYGYGVVDETSIITPSKSVCCKNDTHADSKPLSTTQTNPLKEISTDEKNIITPSKSVCCKNDTHADSKPLSTTQTNPLKEISTHQSKVEDDSKTKNKDEINLSDMIQTNLNKLLIADTYEQDSNINNNNEDNKLDELKSMVSTVFS